MWKKNALFIGLCLLGLGWLSSSLLKRERVAPPRSMNPVRFAPQTENDWASIKQKLDREFQESWTAAKLPHANPADDLTLVRRLSLALTGTVPSLEEVRAVERVKHEERLEWWLSYLLEDRRSAEYVAERLARPMVGTEDGPFIVFRRSKFTGWLADRIQKNQPYDQTVREIIANEGIWVNDPAVNFMSVSFDNGGTEKLNPIKLAARTSRTFLAIRIDCLQCHDDNLGTMDFGIGEESVPGKQTHFHEFAAFFGEAAVSLRGVSDRPEQMYKATYLGEKEEQVVEPHVPYSPDQLGSSSRRREQLSQWITDPRNKSFARATVNRVWAILFGKPLVEPIDDIPLKGPYPAGLETLSDDFIAHGFDLQRLIRVIAASQAYQMESAGDFKISAEHENHWSVFPLTRLRPEQMAQSVIQAGQVSTIDQDAHVIWKLIKFGQTNDFVTRYGDAGGDEFLQRSGTIPQRLLMMNGEFVKERTQPNPAMNATSRIAALASTNATAIEAVYLAVLTRRPTPTELAHFETQFAATSEDRGRENQIEDLYWTLVNSAEFSWNH